MRKTNLKLADTSQTGRSNKIEQIFSAYSDCENGSKAERCLEFKSAGLTAEEILEVLPKAIPFGYNNFDSKKVLRALETAGLLHGETVFFVAREGSPCLYLTSKHNLWLDTIQKLAKSSKADEALFINGQLRLWWD